MRKQVIIATAGILLLACTNICCEKAEETVQMYVGSELFTIEIADTPDEREQGLMNRDKLEPDKGMLFVFQDDKQRSFWMKDTKIPLSIAFISKGGEIKEIYDMEPYSLRPVESKHSVRYALEVLQGTFERLQVAPGDILELPPEARP